MDLILEMVLNRVACRMACMAAVFILGIYLQANAYAVDGTTPALIEPHQPTAVETALISVPSGKWQSKVLGGSFKPSEQIPVKIHLTLIAQTLWPWRRSGEFTYDHTKRQFEGQFNTFGSNKAQLKVLQWDRHHVIFEGPISIFGNIFIGSGPETTAHFDGKLADNTVKGICTLSYNAQINNSGKYNFEALW